MQVATSPDDEAFMQGHEEEDDEYNFVAIEATNSLQDELNKHMPGVSSYVRTSGADSLSTFLLAEDQSISSSTINTSGKKQAAIETHVEESNSSDSSISAETDNSSITSIATDISHGESTIGSLSTSKSKRSMQSSGESSDSSNEGKMGGVSFAKTKEVKLYEVEPGRLNKSVEKRTSKNEIKQMYSQFKEMLSQDTKMDDNQKKIMKQIMATSIKKTKRKTKRPSLGKAGE